MRRKDEAIPAPDGPGDDAQAFDPEALVADLGASAGSQREAIGHVGPYRLLEPIGEGAFGSVYLAEQDRPVRRQVALKVMKPGVDARAVIARFQAERSTLSGIDHPDLGRVYDSGTTREGRPYFATELVHGEPITNACDRLGLSVRERLELMVRVCRAVQHAHAKGLIHRDIKPSNVMAVTRDKELDIKVIDLGLARALNQRLSDHTMYTERGQMVGTPEYMAPEMAEMSGLDIDVRADIYSLGVLLYEVVAGLLPFDPGKMRSMGFAELQRTIRETQPPAPSVRFAGLAAQTEMTGSAERIAVARGHDTRTLVEALQDEFDAIVMACLAKRREDRYQTVAELTRDLERMLERRSLQCCPVPVRLAMGRRMARNRGKVVLAGAAALATLIGAGAIAKGVWHTESIRRDAERQRDGAHAVIDFLVEDFLAAASSNRFGPDLTMRDALSAAEEELARAVGGKGRLAADPLAQAEIYSALFKAYTSLGEPEHATRHAMRALELRKSELGERNPETIVALGDVGAAILAEGKPDAAEPLLEQAAGAARSVMGPEDQRTLVITGQLARDYLAQGRLKDADRVFNETLRGCSNVFGIDHPLTIENLLAVADLLIAQGRHDQASPMLEDVLQRLARTAGEDAVRTLEMMLIVGEYRREHGSIADGEALLRDAHGRMRRVLGEGHPTTQRALYALITALRRQGKERDAEPLIAQAIAIGEQTDGANSPRVVQLRVELSDCLRAQERAAEATTELEKAVESASAALGERSPVTLFAMERLGMLQLDIGQPTRAYPTLKRCLDLRLETLEPDDARIAQSKSLLGAAMGQLGRYQEAEPLLLDGFQGLADAGANKQALAAARQRVDTFYDAWVGARPGGAHISRAQAWRTGNAIANVDEPRSDN